MKNYQHILVGVDFFEQAEAVVEKAKALSETYQASLSIIHVVENMPLPITGYEMDTAFEVDMNSELITAARARLTKYGHKLGIKSEGIWVELGSPKLEITRVAEENNVDLIVIGSHGRHGLAILLGSTANGVLHHAKCDVLAVRLQDN